MSRVALSDRAAVGLTLVTLAVAMLGVMFDSLAAVAAAGISALTVGALTYA